jgi:hypothetical protein
MLIRGQPNAFVDLNAMSIGKFHTTVWSAPVFFRAILCGHFSKRHASSEEPFDKDARETDCERPFSTPSTMVQSAPKEKP